MASKSREAETKVKLGLIKSNVIIAEVLSSFQNCKLMERYKIDSLLMNKLIIKLNRKISTHIPNAATLTTYTVNKQKGCKQREVNNSCCGTAGKSSPLAHKIDLEEFYHIKFFSQI